DPVGGRPVHDQHSGVRAAVGDPSAGRDRGARLGRVGGASSRDRRGRDGRPPDVALPRMGPGTFVSAERIRVIQGAGPAYEHVMTRLLAVLALLLPAQEGIRIDTDIP